MSPASGCTTPQQGGPLEQDTAFVNDSGIEVRYSISLPAGYYETCDTYPVVYALHGRYSDNVAFLDDAVALRRAMDGGVLAQSVIVTPDSYRTGRWQDQGRPAETNFITHLIPHVESSYRVTPGPSHRLLVGFSMGGHGVLRFALKYPDMFAATWTVDGAMDEDSGNYVRFVEGRNPADFRVIAVGGQTNGGRVETVLADLRAAGVDVPYTYYDVPHEFGAFVAADEAAGWPALSFLDDRLGG